MGPVFLFDVGVVILFVGPASGKLDLLAPAVAQKMIVDELGAVIRVDPPQPERQAAAHLIHGRNDPLLGLSQHGPSLHPGAVDVGLVQRVDEFPLATVSRMGDQIDLGKAGDAHLPAIGLDGDMVFEQRSRLGPPVEVFAKPALLLPQMPVDASRTDRQEPLL